MSNDYKYEYINEAQIAEVKELWESGHNEALAAFGLECGNAAVKGYKKGALIGYTKGTGIVLLATLAAYGAFKFSKAVVNKYNEWKEIHEIEDK